MNSDLNSIKLGIIGGGQLGKMLLYECIKMNIKTFVLDANNDSPCKKLSDRFYCGDFKDFETVLDFGKKCDIITFEIEHINIQALEELEKIGKKVFPKSKTLKIIQDKNLQKSFFKENKIPTSNFKFFDSIVSLKKSVQRNEITFPSVWKKTKYGYDGFGVKVLRSPYDIDQLPDCEMIIEDFVSFEKELSVIVCRNVSGEIKTFKTVEMEFNNKTNQVEYVISPALIPEEIEKKAEKLAIQIAKKIDSVGVLAVEMFLSKNQIYINELAPRPHNSGHLTIESCSSSQFQQHIRSVLNLSLGNTEHSGVAIMLNLVGDENFNGPVYYEGLEEVFKQKTANLHLYGKKETRPNRKMGHVTIICDKFEEAYKKAKILKEVIKVKSK